MRRAIKIAGAVIQTVVVVAALGAAVVLAVPRLLGWRVVTVMSGSMTPAYAVNAVLAIDHVDPDNIRVGDVIAFEVERDRPMVAHRVVAVEHDAAGLRFVTKGDANEEADTAPVAASAVRGRVAFGVPYLGLFVRAVQAPAGFVALVVIPGLLLIGLEILSMRRDRRAKTSFNSNSPAPATDGDPEAFDFWTTPASEARYSEELDREVRTSCDSGL